MAGTAPSSTSDSGKRLELFVRKLPRDITEEELQTIFGAFGEIDGIRLIKHQTGSCKGYAFINFKQKSDGLKAMHRLNGMEIRPRLYLDVTYANSNCRLFVGNIPKSKGKEELLQEFRKISPEVKEVIIYRSPDETFRQNRGFCFLEYEHHSNASKGLKTLLMHKPRRIFDCDYLVDWADHESIPGDEVMTRVKTVYAKNLSASVSEDQLKAVFGICGEVGRVKKIKSFAFIHFTNRKDAEEAINTLHGKKLGGTNIEVTWARPPTAKSKREEILRNREIRTAQLLMGKNVRSESGMSVEPDMFNPFQNYASAFRHPTENWRRTANSGFGDQMQIHTRQLNESTFPEYPNYYEEPQSQGSEFHEGLYYGIGNQNALEHGEQQFPVHPYFRS